jgi:dUTP pyrophosphatase
MKIKIKRIDSSLPLPAYHTSGSVAFDIYARKETSIESKELQLIPSNLIIEAPKGYFLLIASRSSTPKKKGLLTPHGLGIIDQDYHGSNDEIGILVYNFSKKSVTVERGERIAQGLILPVEKAEWVEVDAVREQSRGGFGSTG